LAEKIFSKKPERRREGEGAGSNSTPSELQNSLEPKENKKGWIMGETKNGQTEKLNSGRNTKHFLNSKKIIFTPPPCPIPKKVHTVQFTTGKS
jgi:hypothetical protein